MSEYNMSHTGAELDAAIKKVNDGYFLPTGLTKATWGTLTLSSDIYGSQTSYETSKLKINNIGFIPKLFIFRAPTYNDGIITGAKDSSYSIILNSVNFFEKILTDETVNLNVFRFTEFLSKSGSSATLSNGNTGFYLNPNNPEEVYWYVVDSTYKIRAGSWHWEAFA